MKKALVLFSFCISLFVSGQNWELTFEDNFDGAMRPEWTIEEGCDWHHNELQAYKKENVTVENGNLVITAKREETCDGRKQYTSGRLMSVDYAGNGFAQRYGKIEARIKLPKDNGMWPAWWTLGQSLMQGGTWPECGEIDIFEYTNKDSAALGGCYYSRNSETVHWPEGYNWVAAYADVSEYHVYGIIWTENSITWTLDGVPYSILTDQETPMNPMDLSDAERSEFREPHFLLLNLAVGGGAGREPDTDWVESKMYVDWVRTYEDPNYDGFPFAKAGNDKIVTPNESIELDGSESFDFEGELSYNWVQLSGSTAIISGENTSTPTISGLLAVGEYEFELTVTDIANQTATDRVIVAVKDISEVGIALNKPVFASSEENNSVAAVNVNDGVLSTRWASGFSDPEWVMIDLENEYTISGVKLEWEPSFSTKFEIQVSNTADFSNYETLISVVDGNGGTDEFSFLEKLSGRYIRMYGTERTFIGETQYGHSLYEFIVFGNLKKQKFPAEYSLKVMSFNVRVAINEADTLNNWNNRQSLVYEAININSPDVLGVQEPFPIVVQGILDSCNIYSTYGRSRDAVESAYSESCHIYYKIDKFYLDSLNSGTFWFSETPELPGSKDPDAAYIRICTFARLINKVTGSAFYVYNNHWDNVSEQARNRSAVLLVERINARAYPNDPFIVLGDLNARESETSLNYLKNKSNNNLIEMEDTYRLIYPDLSTHNGYTKHRFDGVGYKKIDYVMVEKGGEIETLDAYIETLSANNYYPSDHFPIQANLLFDTTKVSFIMEGSGVIENSNENGKQINVTLINDTFVHPLNPANWVISGLDEAISIGSVELQDSVRAVITLAGNAYTPCYKNIYPLLTIAADELSASQKSVSQNAGVEILALTNLVTGVTLTPTELSLEIGDKGQLSATVSPATASNKNITWISSNDSIAVVSPAGIVTARSIGNAIITVTTVDGSFTDQCEVAVKPKTIPVTGVTLLPSDTVVLVDESYQFTATVSPSNASNKNVTWTSSNNLVASVSSTGLLYAHAAGDAIISVTTEDGEFTALTNITVLNNKVVQIPAQIEAEDYTDMLNIKTESCDEGGENVGWIDENDWIEYEIMVPKSGDYVLNLRVASETNGGDMTITSNGMFLTNHTFDATYAWQEWKTEVVTVNLQAGAQTIRFTSNNNGWNINWIDFKEKEIATIYHIEAEDFVFMDGIDIGDCSDLGGGKYVGWTDAGDWMVYNIEIPAGQYKVTYRVASLNGVGEIKLEKTGGGLTYATTSVTVAKGWQGWDVETDNVTFTENISSFGIAVPQGGYNLNWIEFEKNQKSAALTSKNEISQNLKLSVYPNPVNETLHIKGLEKDALLQVYTLSGSKVFETIGTEVNTCNFKCGIYMISVTSNYQVSKLKFVKN